MRRLSRPCYDKAHRCPGWAGGGMHYPKGPSRCDGGYISTRVPYPGFPGQFEHPGARPWHFGYCNKCNVMTIPVALTQLAPANIRWRVKWHLSSVRHNYRYGRRPR